LNDLKMITKPPSSLVANILLKRIEAEKSKFEEQYADLDKKVLFELIQPIIKPPQLLFPPFEHEIRLR